MLFENIKTGNRLEITFKQERNLGKTYLSQVEEIVGPNQILVQMPLSYGQLVKLPLVDGYSFLFFTEKGMIRFDTLIEGYLKVDEFYFMKVKLLSQGERMQRREFFRFGCVLPLKFARIEKDKAVITEEDEMAEGIMKDLGGGGIRFVSNEDLDEKELIRCEIELQSDPLMLIGKILHKRSFPNSDYKYEYRVEFVGISPQERDKIVQYIFNQQGKALQKTRRS